MEQKIKSMIFGGMDQIVSITKVPANGDCFYAALAAVLLELNCKTNANRPTVADLRFAVSNEVTDETLAMMTHCHNAKIEGYDFMHEVYSVDDLKAAIRKTGRTAGSGHCIWADSFAIQTTSNVLGITLLIIDYATRGGDPAIVAIQPDSCQGLHSEAPPAVTDKSEFSAAMWRNSCCELCTVLVRSRRLHYDLVRINGRCACKLDELRKFRTVK